MLNSKHHNVHKSVTTFGVIIVFITATFCVDASEMTHGEVRAAIRSADLPCHHVIDLKNNGDNAWIVTCNSGKYNVSRDEKGKFSVSPIK